MNKLIGILFGAALWLASVSVVWGQSAPTTEQRIARIDSVLTQLANTTVPALHDSTQFEVAQVRLDQFLQTLGKAHDIQLFMLDAYPQTLPPNYLRNAVVKDVLVVLCRQFQLDMRVTGTVLEFFRYQAPQARPVAVAPQPLNIQYNRQQGTVTFDLRNDPLSAFVRELSQATNINVLVENSLLNQRVTGYIQNQPPKAALEALAATNGLVLEENSNGILTFYPIPVEVAQNTQPQQPGQRPTATRPTRQSGGFSITLLPGPDSLLRVEVIDGAIEDVLEQACVAAGKNYVLLSAGEVTANPTPSRPAPRRGVSTQSGPAFAVGSLTASLDEISLPQLFNLVLRSTDYSYQVEGDIYLVGDKKATLLNHTELIKFQFRPVQDSTLLQYIPDALLNQVEYQVFTELNALIVSGAKADIAALREYIKAIDQPVPNVLIEVIVATVQEGFDVRTGVGVGVSDSAVSTQGTFFPGADVVISSSSLNQLIEQIEATGVINVGRLTPNVYAELRALEDNNYLQVRSTNKLSALNGHRASLKVGESQFYLIQNQQFTGGVNNFNSITNQFNTVEANLSIDIVPVVSGNEHITLDIKAEFSDFVPPTGENLPPGKSTREFVSQIRVKNGEMIVLGGLEEVTKSETRSGFPGLARIPVLKWLFSRINKTKSESKLIVFIKPTIIY